MEWFVAFKYLHIVAMFFAVATALSTELVLRRVAASGDAATIRGVVERVRPLSNVATAFFVAGVVFGLIAAVTGHINLLAPWLILAYVGFVLATLIGIFITDPWVARLEAAAAGTDTQGRETLAAVIADPVARAATWALMFLIAALVFVMVVKPFA